MRESPRLRRLRNDYERLTQLRAESTIFDFDAYGQPAEQYLFRFRGVGLWQPRGAQSIEPRDEHHVRVRLGASYPRMMPELTWLSPIYHPNISASGVVCLGGYATHWVPSLSLDELCGMLWDIIRYRNYDIQSPYNREAALWVRSQNEWVFPVDTRPIRDRIALPLAEPHSDPDREAGSATRNELEAEAIQAELVDVSRPEIIFLESNAE
jgi:ubiquitin-protein ligase